jgi:GldM C-terminal domain
MKILTYSLFLLLFLNACAPAIWQLNDGHVNNQKLQNAFGIATKPLSVDNSTAANIWVENKRNYIYAGVPNWLKITDASDVQVSVGTIKKDSIRLDCYILQVDIPNVSAEVSFESATNQIKAEAQPKEKITYSVLPLPMPEWRIVSLQQGKMLAKDFRKLNNWELIATAVGEKTVLITCSCESFNILKIDSENKRTSAISTKGDFNNEVKKLLETAAIGDIFLIKELKTRCTDKDKVRMMQTLAIEII